jgi:hypothetical protein
MKKVNFEPNERVDAPDANAIGDVASEHVDRLGHVLINQVSRQLDDDQRTALPVAGTSTAPPLVFGHFTVRTYPAESQPYAILITEVPRLFFVSEATGELGALGGLNVEAPVIDLNDFSSLAAGEVFFIYGRIRQIAGVKENRARWRADLNPPREEVYLANTRRLPYFDARASSSALPVAEGWFKIARVTRTASSAQNLLAFSFAHIYTGAFSGAAGIRTDFSEALGGSLIEHSSVPVFGKGITQTISGNETLIAPSVTSLALPITALDLIAHSYSRALATAQGAHSTAYLNALAQGTDESLALAAKEIKDLATKSLSDYLLINGGIDSDFDSSHSSLGAYINRLTALVKSMQLGVPLSPSATDDVEDVAISAWNTPLFAHAELGNISLRSLHSAVSVGLHRDAPAEEYLYSAAAANGLDAHTFMARLVFRLKTDFQAALSAARTIRLTGFIRQPTRQLDQRYFGGAVGGKSSTTLPRFGGIAVRGKTPDQIPNIQMLASRLSADESLNARDDAHHRNLLGEGAFIRKSSGTGACFAWTSSGYGSSLAGRDDNAYSLTVDSLNATDFNLAYERGFIDAVSDNTKIAFDPLRHAACRQYAGEHGVLYIAAGGLTWSNSEFWMFRNPTARETDENTIVLETADDDGTSSFKVPYAGEFIEIVLPPGHAATKPVIFKDCSFFRNGSADYNDALALAAMIRIRSADDEPVNQARVIFESCSFIDFEAINTQVAADKSIGFQRSQAQASRPSFFRFDQAAEAHVEFRSCLFAANVNLSKAQYSDCSFSENATVRYTAHGQSIVMGLPEPLTIESRHLGESIESENLKLIPTGAGLAQAGSPSADGTEHLLTHIGSHAANHSSNSNNTYYNELGRAEAFTAHPLGAPEAFYKATTIVTGGYTRHAYTADQDSLHVVKVEQQNTDTDLQTKRAALQASGFVRVSKDEDRSLIPLLGSSVEQDVSSVWDGVAGGVKQVGSVNLHHGIKSRSTSEMLRDPSGTYNYAAPYRLPATNVQNKRPNDNRVKARSQFYVRTSHDLRDENGLVVENSLGIDDSMNRSGSRGVLRDPLFNGPMSGANYASNGDLVTINNVQVPTFMHEADERSYVQASTVYLGTPSDESSLPSGRSYFDALSRRTATHMRLTHAIVYDPGMSKNSQSGDLETTNFSYYVQAATGSGHTYAGNVQSHVNSDDDMRDEYHTHAINTFDPASTYTNHALHLDMYNNRDSATNANLSLHGESLDNQSSVIRALGGTLPAEFRGYLAIDPFGVARQDDNIAFVKGAIGDMIRGALGDGTQEWSKFVRSPFKRASQNALPQEIPSLHSGIFDTLDISNSELRFRTGVDVNPMYLFDTVPVFKLVRFGHLPLYLIHCTHYSVDGKLVDQGFVRTSVSMDDWYDSSGNFDSTTQASISWDDPSSLFKGGFCMNLDMSDAPFVSKNLANFSLGFEFTSRVSFIGF